ncbi:MAG: hypothetical protein IK066_03615 [Kiritimatiellae bacterium]|nr:hypothetical protein [Kiritimatiellia bacterium]
MDTAASQSTISFAAESGTTYELQRASVLSPTSDWATVDTRRAEDTGTMELTDAIQCPCPFPPDMRCSMRSSAACRGRDARAPSARREAGAMQGRALRAAFS